MSSMSALRVLPVHAVLPAPDRPAAWRSATARRPGAVAAVAAVHALALWAVLSPPRRVLAPAPPEPVTQVRLIASTRTPAAPPADALTTPATRPPAPPPLAVPSIAMPAPAPAPLPSAPSPAPSPAPATPPALPPVLPAGPTPAPPAPPAPSVAIVDPSPSAATAALAAPPRATPAAAPAPAPASASASARPPMPAPAVSVPAPAAPAAAVVPKVVAASALRYVVPPAVEVPLASRRLGERGTVVLRVVFGRDGRPRHVAVERSSGHRRLDEQAVAAMQAARIAPPVEGGDAVEVAALAPIAYELD